jgi:hypothetical protein
LICGIYREGGQRELVIGMAGTTVTSGRGGSLPSVALDAPGRGVGHGGGVAQEQGVHTVWGLRGRVRTSGPAPQVAGGGGAALFWKGEGER